MQNWIEQIKDGRTDFSKSFICIIPSEKMRHAFEQKLLKEISFYHRVHFMTFYEWVLVETEAYRFQHGLRMIEHGEQVRWVLDLLEQMDESILADHQKRLATAETIVAELMLIRMQGLDEQVVNKKMQALFATLLANYDAFLQAKKATDYPQLLQVMVKEKDEISANLVMYPNKELSRLEKEICSLYRIRTAELAESANESQIQTVRSYGFGNAVDHALEKIQTKEIKPDEMYLVYSHPDLLEMIYQKIEKYQIPATFASGIGIESTESYYFIQTIIEYIESGLSLHVLKELVDANLVKIGRGKVRNTFERILSMKGMTTGKRFLAILQHELAQQELSSFLQGREEEIQLIYDEMDAFHQIITRIKTEEINAIDGMIRLVSDFFHIRSKREGQAKVVITRLLSEARSYASSEESAILLTDISTIIAGQRLDAGNEKPGHLHISSLDDVGPLYRKHYCWFGMTTEEFFSRKNQSAFITDRALEKYGIRTEEERLTQLEAHFEGLITNGEAVHSLYFTTFHMERLQENNAISTYTKYEETPEKKSFLVQPLTKEKPQHVLLDIEEEYISVSLYANEEEEKDLFTFSPTSAQALVGCSRKFMYESILRLQENVVEPVERNRWLTANLRGDLYHELLEEYMRKKQTDTVDTEALLEEIFNKYETLYPPIYKRLVEIEKKQATEVLDQFIEKIEEEWHLVALEEAFGFEEPLTITLNEQEAIRIQARGKIDRVDYHEGENKYRVVDYKTGNVKNANRLQIELYERAYKSKYPEKEIQFEQDSFFDFVLKNEQAFASKKEEPIEAFIDVLQNFDQEWDEIDYDSVKHICSYCSFQHMCAIREAKK